MREITVFGMLGALMYASQVAMSMLPNIHLLGVFTVAITLVYRKKALYPIYVYVLLSGIFNQFALWWVPYLYLWLILWGATMLVTRSLPPTMPTRARLWIYAGLCALHGLLFGTMYAPFQALAFGLSLKSTIAWIVAGLPWDAVHGASNLVLGLLILPLANLLTRLQKGWVRQ